MSHHDDILKRQFHLSEQQECPYLPDRQERKVYTIISGPGSDSVNSKLSGLGFRRSQNVLYRPACIGCNACVSIRIEVANYPFSKSQKRVISKNKNLTGQIVQPWATDEQYNLFKLYLDARHDDGGMANMDGFEFSSMIEDTPVHTRLVEYRDESEKLVAVAITDALKDGLSMVYSFFDPNLPKQSLGRFMILDHIRLSQEFSKPFLYMGYWIDGCRKMQYKSDYAQTQHLTTDGWQSPK